MASEDVPDDRSVYSDADDSEDEAFEETSQVAPDVMLHAEERLFTGMGRRPAESSTAKGLERKMATRWQQDYMYHLGICSQAKEVAEFADVKMVCMQGSATRAREFAERLIQTLDVKLPLGTTLKALFKTERFEVYKVGPVLSASHGMGMPSLSILLHEITKLLKYAGATDVLYMRIGTSGGVGLEGGTIVVSNQSVTTTELRPVLQRCVLGKVVERSTVYQPQYVRMAVDAIQKSPEQRSRRPIKVVVGSTLACNDFFEEQGRMDGAIADHTEAQKYEWLLRLRSIGVVNIEMEGAEFAAFCGHLKIPAVLLCVTLLNRIKGDQVDVSAQTLASYSHILWNAADRIVKHVVERGIEPPSV